MQFCLQCKRATMASMASTFYHQCGWSKRKSKPRISGWKFRTREKSVNNLMAAVRCKSVQSTGSCTASKPVNKLFCRYTLHNEKRPGGRCAVYVRGVRMTHTGRLLERVSLNSWRAPSVHHIRISGSDLFFLAQKWPSQLQYGEEEVLYGNMG
jgi:hypothetical protein